MSESNCARNNITNLNQWANNNEYCDRVTMVGRQNHDNNDHQHDGESSEEELMLVASTEEYAAKIIKLQQACLIPLKEDLADWLNKILKTSNITSQNFMDKLDNGVIICRLAKIISLWCEQQLTTDTNMTTTSSTLISSTNVSTHFHLLSVVYLSAVNASRLMDQTADRIEWGRS
jgi:hypothetical protein